MNKKIHLSLALPCIVVLLAGCVATAPTETAVPTSLPSPTPLPTLTPNSKPPEFRIIGYITSGVIAAVLPYDQVTHLNYAFLIPNADGTFNEMPNPWKLNDIVQLAHEKGVKVLISVGGWGWDKEFETVAADPQKRATFVKELVKVVDEYNLDGADIDWEFPDAGQSGQNFLALMRELRVALKDKLLTTAVVSLGENALGIPDETLELVDFLNIMAYDGQGANHSSYELAVQALDYWLGRGLPKEKAVLGVPFYSHPSGVIYRKIIQADPQAANFDEFDYFGVMVNYNGLPTMRRKTELALQRGSGIMIWTLESDSFDPATSLLNAIYQTAHGGNK
jgi:chitinase